jgi:hypothetical protein
MQNLSTEIERNDPSQGSSEDCPKGLEISKVALYGAERGRKDQRQEADDDHGQRDSRPRNLSQVPSLRDNFVAGQMEFVSDPRFVPHPKVLKVLAIADFALNDAEQKRSEVLARTLD